MSGRLNSWPCSGRNDAAHEGSQADQEALSTRVIEGAGVDPTGAWPEERSLFGFGVDLATARVLGRRYRQDVIAWAGVDAVPKLILMR